MTNMAAIPQSPNSTSQIPLKGHLIIVCCHAIWTGGEAKGYDESEWLLAPFHKGETGCFIEHIKTGLRILAESEDGLLVFSGGPTRPETPLSEAQSYLNLALTNNFWSIIPTSPPPTSNSSTSSPSPNVTTDPHSLDSYENLLFSLLTYYNNRQTWPTKISIISHSFKEKRFLELHCRALGLGGSVGVEFLGVEAEYMRVGHPLYDEFKTSAVIEGERVRGYEPWREDLYGKGEFLSGKRKSRNHWGVNAEEVINKFDDPDVRALWEWNGKGLYRGKMPWGDRE